MLFLKRYQSHGVLGRGSLGEVHLAQPIDAPGQFVVVKIMRSDRQFTPQAIQSFERELAYTTRLKHPYIVRFFEGGHDPQHGFCLVMEYVRGVNLQDVLIQVKRLSLQQFGVILGYICHALEAAHLRSVVHQDLKPANLMIVNPNTADEHLKVMDFGLARLSSKPHLSIEQLKGQGVIRAQGTPAYISPEQLRGDEIDGRCDLYSLGIIAYEALTGRLPFDTPDVPKLMHQHLSMAPPKFHDLGIDDVPPGVEAVVQQCLMKNSPNRFPGAAALCRAYSLALNQDFWEATKPQDAPEDDLPIAEEVVEEVMPTNAYVERMESWMPNQIAIIKLSGFLKDTGGTLLGSDPGVVRASYPYELEKKSGLFRRMVGGKGMPTTISVEIRFEKKSANDSKLQIEAIFTLPGGATPRDPDYFQARCAGIANELRKYLLS